MKSQIAYTNHVIQRSPLLSSKIVSMTVFRAGSRSSPMTTRRIWSMRFIQPLNVYLWPSTLQCSTSGTIPLPLCSLLMRRRLLANRDLQENLGFDRRHDVRPSTPPSTPPSNTSGVRNAPSLLDWPRTAPCYFFQSRDRVFAEIRQHGAPHGAEFNRQRRIDSTRKETRVISQVPCCGLPVEACPPACQLDLGSFDGGLGEIDA